MKKKISMQYLLEHADDENLERIAEDYPAPETRRKDLFPEYADSETFEVFPIKRTVRWSAVLSAAAVLVFVIGHGFLFTHLPKPQQAENQPSAEKNIPVQTSVNSPAETVIKTRKETQSTTAVSEQSGKNTTLAEIETTIAVTSVTGTAKASGTAASSGKTMQTAVSTQTQTVTAVVPEEEIPAEVQPIQVVQPVQGLPVQAESSAETSVQTEIPAETQPEEPTGFYLEQAQLDENGCPILPGFYVKHPDDYNLPDTAIEVTAAAEALYSEILTRYKLTYIPENIVFNENDRITLPTMENTPGTLFMDGREIKIHFGQVAGTESSIDNVAYDGTKFVSVSDYKFYPVMISGNYGYIRTGNSATGFEIYVCWVQDGYSFGLKADGVPFSYAEELLRMAESVQKETPEFSLEPAQTDENGLPIIPGFYLKYLWPSDDHFDITPVGFPENAKDLNTYPRFPTEETCYVLNDVPGNLLEGEPQRAQADEDGRSVGFLRRYYSEDETIKFLVNMSIMTSDVNFRTTHNETTGDLQEGTAENLTFYPVRINDNYGYFKVNENGTIVNMTWYQDGYSFFIFPDYKTSPYEKGIPFSYAGELIKIAESVSIIS